MDSLPVILVPSLGGSARLFAGQIAELWRSGPVMIADHLRDDSIEGIARRLLANAPPRFALAGLSMGGYVAFEVLRLAAERIDRLALLDTSAGIDTPAEAADRRAQIERTERGEFAAVTLTQFPHTVHPAHRHDTALRQTFRLMMEDTGPAAFCRQQRAALGRADRTPLLAAIRCPTLVLAGDSDEITPPAGALAMADRVAGARFVTVPECGHLSAIDQPAAVSAALVEWLKR